MAGCGGTGPAQTASAPQDVPLPGAGGARVVETHSAWLVLVGERAYKVKKPVSLGFLDFSTREQRLAVCRAEVALNRRLAPDVYLGVHDLVDESGRPYEHAVVMRRMPADRALSALVRAGDDVGDQLRQLARLVAAFHSTARRSALISAAGSWDSVRRNWQSGLAQLGGFVGPVLDPATYDALCGLSSRYLAGRGPLFAQRQQAGHVCDGHGDLLAADVYCLDDGPRVLDCIEFDERLRYGDVLLDVAFLAMDLSDLGRPDLATTFLELYEEFSGESQPSSLMEHYVAYRAQVRSKVACLRWEQGDEASRGQARDLADLAVRHLERAVVRLVLVGGLPGTGKSTVAAGLADRLGSVLLRSDVVRKELVGLPPHVRAGARLHQGLYAPHRTGRTYEELLRRARTALELGESVVLDASWSDARWRAAAREVATATTSELVELCCHAPSEVAAGRLAARAAHGQDASDADADVARDMALRFAPWPCARPLPTDRPPEEVLVDAARMVREPVVGPPSPLHPAGAT